MSRVLRLDLAVGVHPDMLVLPRAWIECGGDFDIYVANLGGLRGSEADQKALSAGGMSKATGLIKTPHGRGAALDLCPVGFLAHVPVSFGGTAPKWSAWSQLPERLRAQFLELGEFSESLGFTWGGRWRGDAFPNGDQPHHQLFAWHKLPFPAPVYPFPEDLEAHRVAQHPKVVLASTTPSGKHHGEG